MISKSSRNRKKYKIFAPGRIYLFLCDHRSCNLKINSSCVPFMSSTMVQNCFGYLAYGIQQNVNLVAQKLRIPAGRRQKCQRKKYFCHEEFPKFEMSFFAQITFQARSTNFFHRKLQTKNYKHKI